MTRHAPLPLTLLTLLLLCALHMRPCAAYDFLRDYSGISFFDRWDFYNGWDNLTGGDVWWLDQNNAFSSQLAFVNAQYNAVIKVDSASYVPYGQKRNSVRITSRDTFGVGTLWILDLAHIPFGCSVWPAFWAKGPTWPNNGEIDIIEQINLATNNQMALHSLPGCFQSVPVFQTGLSGGVAQTGEDCSTPAGCAVEETAPNSFGRGFALAGGGVWAAQFDVSGVFIWFWSRPNVPPSLTQAVQGTGPVDMSAWGPPSAAYMGTRCNVAEFFSPQQLVFDITLCGDWAGTAANYEPQCGNVGPTGICYNDNVVGSGANYQDAYFEIRYLRAYTTGGPAPTPAPARPGAVWDNKTATAATATVTAWPSGVPRPPAHGAAARTSGAPGIVAVLVGAGALVGGLLGVGRRLPW